MNSDPIKVSAESWTDSEIDDAISRYVFGPTPECDNVGVLQRLRILSTKTNDRLIAILEDSRMHRLAESLKETHMDAPVMRIAELFWTSMPAKAIHLMGPYFTHESPRIRSKCFAAVARSGLADALPKVQLGLNDSDKSVRKSTLISLKHAWKEKSLSSELASGIWPELENRVLAVDHVKEASELLVRFDRNRASRFLLSDKFLNPDKYGQALDANLVSACHILDGILRVANEVELPVSYEKVKALVSCLSKQYQVFPISYVLGQTLVLRNRTGEPL